MEDVSLKCDRCGKPFKKKYKQYKDSWRKLVRKFYCGDCNKYRQKEQLYNL